MEEESKNPSARVYGEKPNKKDGSRMLIIEFNGPVEKKIGPESK